MSLPLVHWCRCQYGLLGAAQSTSVHRIHQPQHHQCPDSIVGGNPLQISKALWSHLICYSQKKNQTQHQTGWIWKHYKELLIAKLWKKRIILLLFLFSFSLLFPATLLQGHCPRPPSLQAPSHVSMLLAYVFTERPSGTYLPAWS